MSHEKINFPKARLYFIDSIPPFAAEIVMPRLSPSDYLITADADIIPLDAAFFNRLDWSASFHLLFNANCCEKIELKFNNSKVVHIQHYPMSYAGASVSS